MRVVVVDQGFGAGLVFITIDGKQIKFREEENSADSERQEPAKPPIPMCSRKTAL
jgi:hypothetical protein